jgi:hypothetical protein
MWKTIITFTDLICLPITFWWISYQPSNHHFCLAVSPIIGRSPVGKVARTATATPWARPPRPVTSTPASASASQGSVEGGVTSVKKTTTEIRRWNKIRSLTQQNELIWNIRWPTKEVFPRQTLKLYVLTWLFSISIQIQTNLQHDAIYVMQCYSFFIGSVKFTFTKS